MAASQNKKFVGGLVEIKEGPAARPYPVRNDAARAGEEVVVLRYWKVKKGSFDEFLKASQDGVWPYFEKLGARIVGLWKVVHPEIDGETAGTDNSDHDEIYLVTRYASVDHWRMTRETFKHGGNGPDFEQCKKSLAVRQSFTLDSSATFLQGCKWDNSPWYMPAVVEQVERVGE